MTKILSLEKGIEALRNENLELKEENTVLKTKVVNLKKSCLQVELVQKDRIFYFTVYQLFKVVTQKMLLVSFSLKYESVRQIQRPSSIAIA